LKKFRVVKKKVKHSKKKQKIQKIIDKVQKKKTMECDFMRKKGCAQD